MSDVELTRIVEQLQRATVPEDVFGTVSGSTAHLEDFLKRRFRQLARICHPDHYLAEDDKQLATQAFAKLTVFWQAAQDHLKVGDYGQKRVTSTEPVIVRSPKAEYAVTDLITSGDLANLYHASYTVGRSEKTVIFKVVRQPSDSDLLEHEAEQLRLIDDWRLEPGFRAYLPSLVESFAYKETGSGDIRRVNVLEHVEGLYSLTQIKEHFPGGLDPKHVAWIWGRVLIVLNIIHHHGLIHGAVLPPHLLIHPEQHGVVLVDLAYATQPQKGQCLAALPAPYESWYPKEVFDKQLPTPGLDIYLAARSMTWLLGEDPLTGVYPRSVPVELQRFFRGCTLESPRMRPQDANALRSEFHQLIEQLWGRRIFRPFSLKAKAN